MHICHHFSFCVPETVKWNTFWQRYWNKNKLKTLYQLYCASNCRFTLNIYCSEISYKDSPSPSPPALCSLWVMESILSKSWSFYYRITCMNKQAQTKTAKHERPFLYQYQCNEMRLISRECINWLNVCHFGWMHKCMNVNV